MLPQKLAFVDIETTGLGVTRDRIIEIGILRVENNRLVKSFQSLINPEGFVSPFSLQLTGITQEELEKAPTFFEIQGEIFDLLNECTFVAHNVRFDYSFIRNEFRRHRQKFTAKHFCTVKLSQKLFPQYRHHNLDAIIERFNISCEKRHRAFDDAKVLWDFYQKLQLAFTKDILEEAIKRTSQKTSIPIAIPSATIDNLPEKPGVYIFYADNQMPLYVGKSINIKERVMSHFTSDHESTREMNISQQVKNIETITTSGELGALIKESQLIKSLQPLYNRQLRVMRKINLLKKKTNSKGYTEVILEMADKINPNDLFNILGIFKSKRQAKNFLIPLVKKYNLCEKLLGLEKTSMECFAYRLGVCKGACVERENTIYYNTRFIEAFKNFVFKPWPFSGPIVISEEDFLEDTGEYFVVDKWCLLSKYVSSELTTLEVEKNDYVFDLDTYKLLVKFLENKKNWKFVKPLKNRENKVSISSKHLSETSFDS